tara:strand:- start:328 stop:702 length:375 start_codon:yes stop_codon:yes gene_type:complete
MRRFLIIIILGLLWSGSVFAETKKKDKDFVYLECRSKDVTAVMGYGLNLKHKIAGVPSVEKKIDFVELKITPTRYEFEYESRIAKHLITINRFSGELIEIWNTEIGKEVFYGKCVKRDLDKPKL